MRYYCSRKESDWILQSSIGSLFKLWFLLWTTWMVRRAIWLRSRLWGSVECVYAHIMCRMCIYVCIIMYVCNGNKLTVCVSYPCYNPSPLSLIYKFYCIWDYDLNPQGLLIPRLWGFSFDWALHYLDTKLKVFRECSLYPLDGSSNELQNIWNLILWKLRRWRLWFRKIKENMVSVFLQTTHIDF